MYVRRFYKSILVCLFLGWAVLGYYPFGLPIFELKVVRPDYNPLVALSTIAAFWIMCAIGVAGFIVCAYVYHWEQNHRGKDAMWLAAKRAHMLAWAAPFAILVCVAAAVNWGLDYLNGEASWVLLVLIVGCVFWPWTMATMAYAAVFPKQEPQR